MYAGAKRAGHPAKGAGAGGWDSARFLELVLNDGRFPFRELVLPSRPHQGASRPLTQAIGRVAKSIERPDLYVIESNKL
jgi:hypothetical protein